MSGTTCSECQLQIFDGELDRDAVVHLTGCEECRALDREVRLNASALAAMREDLIPVRRARRWPWIAAAAAVLTAAVGIGYPPAEPAAPAPAVKMQAAAPALPVPVVTQPAPRVRRARVAKPQPLLVKFLTDDPDVVIYWLIDPVQGEQAI